MSKKQPVCEITAATIRKTVTVSAEQRPSALCFWSFGVLIWFPIKAIVMLYYHIIKGPFTKFPCLLKEGIRSNLVIYYIIIYILW